MVSADYLFLDGTALLRASLLRSQRCCFALTATMMVYGFLAVMVECYSFGSVLLSFFPPCLLFRKPMYLKVLSRTCEHLPFMLTCFSCCLWRMMFAVADLLVLSRLLSSPVLSASR